MKGKYQVLVSNLKCSKFLVMTSDYKGGAGLRLGLKHVKQCNYVW